MKKIAKLLFFAFYVCSVFSIDSPAQISRVEPERPRWGETLTVIYNAAESGAKLKMDDEVYLVARLYFPGGSKNLSLRMAREGELFKAPLSIQPNLSHFGLHFITLKGGWDEQAYITSLVYREDGKPARGALESKIRSQRYQEFFKQEIELYPDNYSAYRAKWGIARALEGEKAAGTIGFDLRKLGSVKDETPELLRALSSGNLISQREEKSRELIWRLVEKFPESAYTALAIDDYEEETSGRGAGVVEIARIKITVMQKNPGGDFARRSLAKLARDQRAPLDLIEVIAQQWITDDPGNPQPYFSLAQAYQNQYRKYEQAPALIEQAIALLQAGGLRLFGDVNGKQTAAMLPAAFLTSADLAFRQNQPGKAISGIKAAQEYEPEPRYAAHLLEAKVWQSVNKEAQAEAAFVEAWRRGSTEAEERLKARYNARRGDLQGFDEYLLAASRDDGSPAPSRRPAPPFKMTSLDGKTYELNALQGKIIVLNLWFKECGPCRKEIPKLNQVAAEFKDKNVVFLAPSLDGAEALRSFLKTTRFDYQIVPDAETIIIEKFGATAFPTHIVIDQDGQIDTMLVGGAERRPEEVRRALLRLLNVQASQ